MSQIRILVVDDDPRLLKEMKQSLSSFGYGVRTVESAEEALSALGRRWYQWRPYRPDIVITDFRMSGKNGLTLARQLQRIKPGLPVILQSGGSLNFDREVREEAGIKAMLRKPVGGLEMKVIIERVLLG